MHSPQWKCLFLFCSPPISVSPSFLSSFSRCNLSRTSWISPVLFLLRAIDALPSSLSLSLPLSRACTHLHGTFAITRSYTCVVTESVAWKRNVRTRMHRAFSYTARNEPDCALVREKRRTSVGVFFFVLLVALRVQLAFSNYRNGSVFESRISRRRDFMCRTSVADCLQTRSSLPFIANLLNVETKLVSSSGEIGFILFYFFFLQVSQIYSTIHFTIGAYSSATVFHRAHRCDKIIVTSFFERVYISQTGHFITCTLWI